MLSTDIRRFPITHKKKSFYDYFFLETMAVQKILDYFTYLVLSFRGFLRI